MPCIFIQILMDDHFYFFSVIANIIISSNCHAQFYKSYMPSHFYFCCLIGNIIIGNNCRAKFYKSFLQGGFYFYHLIGNIAICSNCASQQEHVTKTYRHGFNFYSTYVNISKKWLLKHHFQSYR